MFWTLMFRPKLNFIAYSLTTEPRLLQSVMSKTQKQVKVNRPLAKFGIWFTTSPKTMMQTAEIRARPRGVLNAHRHIMAVQMIIVSRKTPNVDVSLWPIATKTKMLFAVKTTAGARRLAIVMGRTLLRFAKACDASNTHRQP